MSSLYVALYRHMLVTAPKQINVKAHFFNFSFSPIDPLKNISLKWDRNTQVWIHHTCTGRIANTINSLKSKTASIRKKPHIMEKVSYDLKKNLRQFYINIHIIIA